MNNHLKKKKSSPVTAVFSNSEANAYHLPVCNNHAGLNFMSSGGDDRLKAVISIAATVDGKFSPQQLFHCGAGFFLIAVSPLRI